MKQPKEKPFWHDMDPEYKAFHRDIHKHILKLGWKGVFFEIIKHQRKVEPSTGYNFDHVKAYTKNERKS